MATNMDVSSVTIPDLLEKLRLGEWQVPKFQRDFVWTTTDVINLVLSVLDKRPIGMVTLWEQAESQGLDLERLSVPDAKPESPDGLAYFGDPNASPPKSVYAILDGRQRCTALAMAFGGFRARNRKYKFSGRYFLNVAEKDPIKRIDYLREADVVRRQLDNDAICIGQGRFPLSSNQVGEPLLAQWYRYSQSIRDPQFYKDGVLPESAELDRRNEVLRNAFEGIIQTKLAVYTVPGTYGLAEICDIFETLNTSGTKVSTVDLIHSWLYADTGASISAKPLELRQWINDFGQKHGAIGWSSTAERPELVAQIVTACYVASTKRYPPRKIGKADKVSITSVKSSDLLATPPGHWHDIIGHDSDLAAFIGDFQQVVADGFFPWSACPYPVSAAIYVALRWHHKVDAVSDRSWSTRELDPLYRAFFWRNALSQRYDQGFLTQLGSDIEMLKSLLNKRPASSSRADWAKLATAALDRLIPGSELPTTEQLVRILTDEKPVGAMQKALLLLLVTGARRDLLEPDVDLSFPGAVEPELHHIYPKAWCDNNKTPRLAVYLNSAEADRNWVESIANLMPLSRDSNSKWRAKNPGQLLREKGIEFAQYRNILEPMFLDAQCFADLLTGEEGIPQFWEHRAALIAAAIRVRTDVTL